MRKDEESFYQLIPVVYNIFHWLVSALKERIKLRVNILIIACLIDAQSRLLNPIFWSQN